MGEGRGSARLWTGRRLLINRMNRVAPLTDGAARGQPPVEQRSSTKAMSAPRAVQARRPLRKQDGRCARRFNVGAEPPHRPLPMLMPQREPCIRRGKARRAWWARGRCDLWSTIPIGSSATPIANGRRACNGSSSVNERARRAGALGPMGARLERRPRCQSPRRNTCMFPVRNALLAPKLNRGVCWRVLPSSAADELARDPCS